MQLQSVQALFAGGISFNLPYSARDETPSPDGASFKLYASRQQAEASSYNTQIKVISYVTTDVSGLTPGAPVNALGIEVGDVTGIDLLVAPSTGKAKVRVTMQLQPQRISALKESDSIVNSAALLQRFVNNGMRVEIGTANYVTGQKEVDLVSVPNAKPAKVKIDGNAIVLPFETNGVDTILANATDITNKINKIPLQNIVDNLDRLLKTTNNTLGGPQTRQLIRQLSLTLQTANTTLKDIQTGFGQDSDFQRNLGQVLNQANATLQSLQALSTYLDQHPQSVIFGRSGS
jgi:paraquat-inducible protein B